MTVRHDAIERTCQLRGRYGMAPPPLPDDYSYDQECRVTAMQADQKSLLLDEMPRFLLGDDPLAESFARLGSLSKQRESSRKTESRPYYTVNDEG